MIRTAPYKKKIKLTSKKVNCIQNNSLNTILFGCKKSLLKQHLRSKILNDQKIFNFDFGILINLNFVSGNFT